MSPILLSLFSLNAIAGDAFPLKSIRYDVVVTGPYAEVTVEQTFGNTNEAFIEALYSFPLHQQSAVDEMSMRIGDRVIQGVIQTKEDARKTYEDAKTEGRTAALTEQVRPNMFSQSIANIAPMEEVHVSLHLVQPLSYEDGVYRLELPLTIGPRFTPAGSLGGEVSVDVPVVSGSTGVSVDIAVDVDMGTAPSEIWSTSHPEIRVEEHGTLSLIDVQGVRPDRDFVVDIDLVGDEPMASLLTQDGHFALTLEPQDEPTQKQQVPRELIFVVDNSCSMNGWPLDNAKEAMRAALEGMMPEDSFQVLRFSEAASAMSPRSLPATPENIERGIQYVEGMRGMGGTHMLAGIEAALVYPEDPEKERIVCFMTDGYIGNEREILAAIEDQLGDARLFSFGVGSSVNRYLLEEMSVVGRGDVTWLMSGEESEQHVRAFYERIARPLLTDVQVTFPGVMVMDQQPVRIPDVFDGQPIQVLGRYEGELEQVIVTGRMGNKAYREIIDVVAVDDGTSIASAWARQQVRTLERAQNFGPVQDIEGEITELALEYKLLTRYTSFVAVDYIIRNAGGDGDALMQPSLLPFGVDGALANAELSRHYMPPGDPLLTIDAPASAEEVTVVFPWGEIASLAWDEQRERWFHRFLVPRDIDDGVYTIRVFVNYVDGSTEIRTEELVIDSLAPELDVEMTIERGVTRVVIYPQEPLRSLWVQPLGRPELRRRVDMRRVERPEDGVEIVLVGEFDQVEIVAKDRAMNRISVIQGSN